MILRSKRLILRPFKDSDNAPYAQMGANPNAMKFFQNILGRAQCDANIVCFKNALAKDGIAFLAAELKQTSQFIGVIGLAKVEASINAVLPETDNVEIGWAIHPDFWGLGLAPEGARACLNFAWDNLKLTEIVSFTAKTNLPSQRVMEKIGMSVDSKGEFEHPELERSHPLCKHVLYRIKNPHSPQTTVEYR